MERKTAGALIKRLDDKGHGVAVIATLNTIDKDGDVTRPGAFGAGQVAPMVPAHNWEHVPIGKGRIYESGNEVLYDFRMNMKIDLARAWHEALKFDMQNPPPKQQWSYGYSARRVPGQHDGRAVQFLDGIRVHEVSPVLLGAGVNTRTLSVKQDRGLAAATAAAVAEYERIEARRQHWPTKSAGKIGWKIVHGWDDGMQRRAIEYAGWAAEELGCSVPRLFLFRRAFTPDEADFRTDTEIAGICFAKRRGVGICERVVSEWDFMVTVAHELHHFAQPGADEAAAERFGLEFAARRAGLVADAM